MFVLRYATGTVGVPASAILLAPIFFGIAALLSQPLAENALFRAMYSDLYALPRRPVNLARFAFLHRDLAEQFYPNWGLSADINVAILRTEAGRNPDDADLQALIGELSTCSDEFRTRWGAHNVRHHANGDKHFVHPVVGDLRMTYEAFEPMGDPGLNFLIYSAVPGSATDDALKILASWYASQTAVSRTMEHPAERPTDGDHRADDEITKEL